MKLPQTQEELDTFEDSCNRLLENIVRTTGYLIIGMVTVALYVHIYRLLFT